MPDCSSCKSERKSVPLIVHESSMARMERALRRLWVLAIILVLLLVGSNVAWIVYENQYEDIVTTETYEAITGRGAAIANGSGEVRYYGAGEVHEND